MPTFLIIGAPKSGTTSLAAYLAVHPEIFMSAQKELHYFDIHYQKGVDWYRAHFAKAGHARAVGEATPTYFLTDEALSRQAALLPDARLILLLRNPVDAAWSAYWFNRSIGFERRDFEEAVRQELGGEGEEKRYLRQVRYIRRIERVCAHYPRDALLVRTLDDLSERTAETFSATCRHVGVDDRVAPANLAEVYNPSTRLRSERLREWMLRYNAWRRLPVRVASAIDRWNRIPARYPPMDPSMQRRVSDLLEDDTAALEAWLGRDLSNWRR